MTNIIEKAVKSKLRFPTAGKSLSTEDLYSLPLKHPKFTSLNSLAIEAHTELMNTPSVSFVEDVKPVSEAAIRLEVLKHIIEEKKSIVAANELKAAEAANRTLYEEAYKRKQLEKINGLSEEDLLSKLK